MSFHIKIGNYRFSKNLGTGSFGKVKLAFNEVSGHKVAIKIMNKKKIKQQQVFDKIKREIKVLRLFNHPHIIKHYEFIDTPSDIFMVIEFASGGELFDLISRREKLDENEARRFFQQIFSSIEYTHFHKITHRDLKPENLLLDEHNNIKLIDFGLSNSMKDSQSLKTACGSPNYAAPEIISGRSYGGVEVDVWSMGVILYAMVCGTLPFDDDSMSQLFNKIKEGKYYMPNYISADVKDLINRMLQPNPIKRITMTEIKHHPWYIQDLPPYLSNISQIAQNPQPVDEEIVKKIFTLNLNLQGKPYNEIVRCIQEKRNTDFCGIYELYYHDKIKRECLSQQQAQQRGQLATPKRFKSLRSFILYQKAQQSSESQMAQTLLTKKQDDRLKRILHKLKTGEVDSSKNDQQLSIFGSPLRNPRVNSLISTTVEENKSQYTTGFIDLDKIKAVDQNPNQLLSHKQKWQFGLIITGPVFEIMELTCLTLQKLNFEWQFVPKEMKLKCQTVVDENEIQDNDEAINLFLRKHFIKFYINLYKVQAKANDERFMIDIHLFKGNPMLFQDFTKCFVSQIHHSCNIISKQGSLFIDDASSTASQKHSTGGGCQLNNTTTISNKIQEHKQLNQDLNSNSNSLVDGKQIEQQEQSDNLQYNIPFYSNLTVLT
eukprot:403354418